MTMLSIQGPVTKKFSGQAGQVAAPAADQGQMINFNKAISGSVRADSVLSVYSKSDQKNSIKKIQQKIKMRQADRTPDDYKASKDGVLSQSHNKTMPNKKKEGSSDKLGIYP